MDFFKILKLTTNDETLTYSDICVMAVIATYAQYQDDKTVELSANDVHAEFPRLSVRTISRAIERLTANKYIEIIKAKGAKNKYRVLIPIDYSKPITRKSTKNETDIEKYNVVINKF